MVQTSSAQGRNNLAHSIEKDSIPRFQSPYRYVSYGFNGASQDSATDPPTQNPEKFELLENILPPVDGPIERRWGYDRWPEAYGGTRLAVYQKDSATQRNIIVADATSVRALNEDGTVYDSSLFTPTVAPRITVSREYAYFTGSNKKWNGDTATEDVTDWGIQKLQGTTAALYAGTVVNSTANGGTVDWVVDGIGTLTNAISSDNAIYDTPSGLGTGQISKHLKCTNFSASLSAGETISYITLNVRYRWTGTASTTSKYMTAVLLKNGVPASTPASLLLTLGSPFGYLTPSGTDIYRTTYFGQADGNWLATDVNSSTFGVALEVVGLTGFNLYIDEVNIIIATLGTPPSAAVAAGSGVTLTIGRKYCVAAVNSSTGHISDITGFSSSTGPVVDDQVNLTSIPSSTDTQVDYKYLLATADGGDETKLYYLDSITNATTTYTDTTPEETLLLRNVFLELDEFGNELGVTDNTPPLVFVSACKHRGRMYGIAGQNVYFSKSEAELTTSTGTICGKYEESWPADYFFDISQGVETPRALLSDGESLYIGTEKHIYRLIGDGPENFRKPEIAFNTIGVVNQEVWQVVYNEGSAAGAMWLTPTKRLIWSDMNSYRDIGVPVQDVLDSINASAINTSNAVSASYESFDLYILAIPTGVATTPNVLLICELGSGTWFQWTTTDSVYAQLFNVKSDGNAQLLFASDNRIYEWNTSSTTDETGDSGDAVNITSTMRTSWMPLGDQMFRKTLNEAEILTTSEDLTLSIDGASNMREFTTPSVVVDEQTLTPGPLGETKIKLAGRPSKDRYYQLTFTDAGTDVEILSGYSLEISPLHKI